MSTRTFAGSGGGAAGDVIASLGRAGAVYEPIVRVPYVASANWQGRAVSSGFALVAHAASTDAPSRPAMARRVWEAGGGVCFCPPLSWRESFIRNIDRPRRPVSRLNWGQLWKSGPRNSRARFHCDHAMVALKRQLSASNSTTCSRVLLL